MSWPWGQRRWLASRRGRQGSLRPRRSVRVVCTGPKPGAVRVANTHGCAATVLGDAFAAGQAGADDLAGVVLVDRRAGGAGVLAAVPAGDTQHTAGFGVGVVDDAGLAGGAVDGVDASLEADRAGAVAGGGELGFPAVEVVAGG